MKFTFQSTATPASSKTDCLVLILGTDLKKAHAKSLDKACGLLTQLEKSGELPKNAGSSLMLRLPRGVQADRLLLLGSGTSGKQSDPLREDRIGRELGRQLADSAAANAIIMNDAGADDKAGGMLESLAAGIVTGSYRYAETLSTPPKPSALKQVKWSLKRSAAAAGALQRGLAIGEGINVARHLGDLPGNFCTPAYLAKRSRQMARGNDQLSCSVLSEKKMAELGMGSLLSVTAGTEQPAQLIVLEYRGAGKQKPKVLVGKGVTFDSGGISIKPGARMDEMKYDMCGAASVLGTMHTVCQLGLEINVTGIVAAVENMPDGRATKPGDVVTSMSGKTIEILNTDAEGRLILCDALTFAARFKPDTVIDIATLTGACVVALGKHATALYANDEALADDLLNAGKHAADRAWRMPLWDDYQNQLKSNFADMGNIGGPEAGSVTAACFLSRFTEDYRWAHLDIAGSAWNSGAAKGATGRPVGLLSHYLIGHSGKRGA